MLARFGMNPWMIIGALAFMAGASAVGYHKGKADCVAAYQSRELEIIAESRKLDNQRRAAELARDALSKQLEEQAYAEPVVVTQCLSPSRVRRINSLR